MSSLLQARYIYNLSNRLTSLCKPMCITKTQRLESSNKVAESFLSGSNANYLEAQYVDWARSKGSIDQSWDGLYDSLTGPALKIEDFSDEFATTTKKLKKDRPKNKQSEETVREKIMLNIAVHNLIRSYQARGHLLAKIDPLGLRHGHSFLRYKTVEEAKNEVIFRELKFLDDRHYDMVFPLTERTYIGGDQKELTLREMISRLESIYCAHVGVEYMHLLAGTEMKFIRKRFELPGALDHTVEEKHRIMQRLVKAVFLEKYFATKWPAEKRFGLEGGEALIVLMEQLIDTASQHGVQAVVLAMPHRGRLNMLVNVCRKQLVDIFGQFKPLEPNEPGSGDIKYHLGTYIHRFIKRTSKYIKVSMSANPSHLEVVTPVALGKCKAEQFFKGDYNGDRVLSIILHGDAAFVGQGVVYESVHLGELPGFTNKGTIHIVCNNQIGYTTDPWFSRSSPYCSDVAKCVNAPVFHVNGDEPESVSNVAKISMDFRCKFKKDVFIDFVCYRKHGHSEEDEPMFTQPHMYTKIRTMETVDKIYAKQLKAEGILTDAHVKQFEDDYLKTLNEHFELSKKVTKLSIMDWIDTPWTGFFQATDPNTIKETGISETTLMEIAKHFTKKPAPPFKVFKGLERILANRQKLIDAGTADWAMGEAFAYGSLLRDKIHIRFSGEDVERGTMAHRHHVYHHQGDTKAEYRVFDVLYPDQANYSLVNSSLSEFAVLGFEVGYSNVSPYVLTIWEAQYGDFADTAQPVFDTFICNGESKWLSQSGIVIQLPHGIDGAGPEHSSARPERYLMQCDDDEDYIPDLDDPMFAIKQLRAANWIVANCTCPANYFHLMRRQLAMPFRKPIVLMTPKVGLKHPFYTSSFKDFLVGTTFQRLIPEKGEASKCPQNVKKLILCCGKVAITISELIAEKKLEKEIAVARIEQIYPVPYDLILKEVNKYNCATLCFVQEEHKNQGPGPFLRPRIENLVQGKIQVIARPSSAASATGIKWLHQKELKELKEEIVKL